MNPTFADFTLTEPLRQRPGRLVARARRGGVEAVVHIAHPPSRLVRPDSAFGGAASELFGPGAPACGVRFEARVLAHLAGVPGVPALLGSGTHEGAPWLAHAFVDGPSLAQAPPADPVAFARQMLKLLAALHARGVVHRALRPACVLPGPHLIDFEGAALADQAIPGRVGTPSPEQVARSLGAAIELDHRVDLYALGGLLPAVPALAPLIEALRRPRSARPFSAEAALAVLEGARAPAYVAPTRFVEALRLGDPEAALALAQAEGSHRRVAHVAAALGQHAVARAALAQAPPSPDLALVAAELDGESAETTLPSALQNTSDSGVLAAAIEVALGAFAYGLAVAAAVRAATLDARAGADLLRHVTGRLLIIETRAGDQVAEALVTACVAQALVGQGIEAPALVRRSWTRAVEAGAGLLRGRPSAEAAVLLACAGAALDAPWVDRLLAYARRASDSQEIEVKRESLRDVALDLLGLPKS